MTTDNHIIKPGAVAFDIDGVFADTMSLFLQVAREEYNITHVKYEDITCYMLEDCIDVDEKIIWDILIKLVNGSYNSLLKPMPGAIDVLTRLAMAHPLLFVTARSELNPVLNWISAILPVDSSCFDVVATGSFDAKAEILLNKNIQYFVEDRLETCFPLKEAGVNPVVFKQPWNRKPHPFLEVSNWQEIETLIQY